MLAGDQRGGERPVSPSDKPTIASSRPSISWPEPTSWDSPSVAASGTSFPSTVADRSIDTKSPFCAGRSTPVSVPNRARRRLQLRVDVLVGHLDRVDGDFQRLQIGKGDLGTDVDLGGEGQILAVLLLGDLDLGLPERAHVRRRHRLAVAARDGVVDHLVEHRLLIDARLEQLDRPLPGRKPGSRTCLAISFSARSKSGSHFREGHLHVDANPGGAQLLDGALHGRAPCMSVVVVLVSAVGVTGFEPAAFRSQSGCATKLRYTPRLSPVSRSVRSRGDTTGLITRDAFQLDLIPSAPVQSAVALHCGRSSMVEP